MSSRVEYDAFRVDLEELNLRPRDAGTLARLERAQRDFQDQRDRYQRVRRDLSVKVRLLEHNKVRARRRTRAGTRTRTPANPACLQVKVLHQQLWLLHGAMAAHSLSCHAHLEQSLQQAMTRLRDQAIDSASFLEES